ncbi:MAG: MBL fold metallo-hydrolase [Treponema sp.]|nr:MBL fold metallo-hydrolase [Treponema sp.]
MGISVYSLGAAGEVTGSKHVLEIDGIPYMIDCGAFQGRRAVSDAKNRNFDFPVDKLGTVILTHGHYDHCGLLPILVKRGFKGNIYATPATRDLANVVMMDSARIQARDAEYLGKQAKKKGEKFTWKPLFDEADCTKAADQIITVSYKRNMYIAPSLQLEFFDAGHILGSAFAYLTVKGRHGTLNAPSAALYDEGNEIRILYTGDIGRPEKPIIRKPANDMPAPDYIFLESTYGNRLHEESSFAMTELERIVNEAVAKKGKIIIPSFAIERAQELIYYLHLLVDKKKIPSIPIYIDSPMAVSVTGIFGIHPECYDDEVHDAFLKHHKNPFGFGALSYVTSVEESKALNDREGPMIIISADGMCEAGRILHHLYNNISNPKNTILIVGYMAENTLGRKILDGEKEVKILDEWFQVKANVEQIDAFSAHADYEEMISWLKSIDTSRLKQIFLVHGETDALNAFTQHLWEAGFKDVTTVKYGERYDLT